jgi:NADP-dependent 3-hydroxy acid dehydrogenase YdfG
MYVFITGASSGIGRAIALHLAGLSPYTVFAGVRDITAFAEPPPRIIPIVIDVTIRATIEESVADLSERISPDEELALVSNAGMAVFGPLEYIPTEQIRRHST